MVSCSYSWFAPMECRSAPSNAGSLAANAGLRGRQLQLIRVENRLECRSGPFQTQVATAIDPVILGICDQQTVNW